MSLHLAFLAVFALACTAAIGVSGYFIVCQRYEEGIVGNLFAGFLVILPAVVVLADVLRGIDAREGTAILWLVIGLTWMLGRHAWRSFWFWWAPKIGLRPPRDAVGPCATERARG